MPSIIAIDKLDEPPQTLRDFVAVSMQRYFKEVGNHTPAGLYQLVLGEMEAPLLQCVLDFTDGNQTKASQILGMTRSTLRKKLHTHELLDNEPQKKHD